MALAAEGTRLAIPSLIGIASHTYGIAIWAITTEECSRDGIRSPIAWKGNHTADIATRTVGSFFAWCADSLKLVETVTTFTILCRFGSLHQSCGTFANGYFTGLTGDSITSLVFILTEGA